MLGLGSTESGKSSSFEVVVTRSVAGLVGVGSRVKARFLISLYLRSGKVLETSRIKFASRGPVVPAMMRRITKHR